ncbi:hypothetical protein [Dongia deserti]|uniref:hypothetical protein n=1 Tax=Dongia deserti TaxID=2268030 RepID=UPI0013C51F7F|nr:hypothetical protein [Dongia deserti]
MSGQSPLLRIGMTCAAIVVGSAIIGSQLSTSTDVSRVSVDIADEEDAGAAEESAYASSEEGEDDSEDDADEYAEGSDEDWAGDEDVSQADYGPEDQGNEQADEEDDEDRGFTAVRRNP